MLLSELHAVQETRGSKCVSIWEKQSGGLFRSECINSSEFAYGKPTSLYKGGLGAGDLLPPLPQANAEGLAVGIAGGILCIAIYL